MNISNFIIMNNAGSYYLVSVYKLKCLFYKVQIRGV